MAFPQKCLLTVPRVQGETREPKKDMIYIDSEGNQKHVKDVDAKLVEREREGVHPGKVMAVTRGTHSGLLCEVLALGCLLPFAIVVVEEWGG